MPTAWRASCWRIPIPMADAVQHAQVARGRARPSGGRIRAAQSHPDLLVLERTVGDNGKLRSVIRVDDARRVVRFSRLDRGRGRLARRDRRCGRRSECRKRQRAAEGAGGAAAAGAVSARQPCAGPVLPTIRSRCRRLMLRPLSTPSAGAGRWRPRPAEVPDDAVCCAAAGGQRQPRAVAVGRAGASSCASRRWRCSRACRDADPRALHALADGIAGSDPRHSGDRARRHQ